MKKETSKYTIYLEILYFSHSVFLAYIQNAPDMFITIYNLFSLTTIHVLQFKHLFSHRTLFLLFPHNTPGHTCHAFIPHVLFYQHVFAPARRLTCNIRISNNSYINISPPLFLPPYLSFPPSEHNRDWSLLSAFYIYDSGSQS